MRPQTTITIIILLANHAFTQTTLTTKTELRPSTAELRFEQLAVIGNDETSAESFLAMPIAVRTDADGSIYVCDKSDYCLKVYASDGDFLKRFPREEKEILKHVDREGYWYTTSNYQDMPVVTKYRVEIM